MKRPARALLLGFGGLAAIAEACSARSIVIGGDPVAAADEGSAEVGGAPASGGTLVSGGAFSTGGVVIGGATATGGSSVSVGGASPSTGGPSAEGGADGAFDPYPPVAYENGQGYRHSCRSYDGAWGFTCWNFDEDTHSCSPTGDPYCNACSCAVPCESGRDCPLGVTGHPADCVASATTAKSCFLVCDDRPCPMGMTCAPYPGAARNVCVWVTEPAFGQPTR